MGGSFQGEEDMHGLFTAKGVVFARLDVGHNGPELFQRLRQQFPVVGQCMCDGRVKMQEQMEHPCQLPCQRLGFGDWELSPVLMPCLI